MKKTFTMCAFLLSMSAPTFIMQANAEKVCTISASEGWGLVAGTKNGATVYYKVTNWGTGKALVFRVENKSVQSQALKISYSFGLTNDAKTIEVSVNAGEVKEAPANGSMIIRLTDEQVTAVNNNKLTFKIN